MLHINESDFRRIDLNLLVGDEIAEHARGGPGLRSLVGPPLMHGAAQWGLFINLGMGSTCFFANENKKLDPADFLATIEREKINSMTIVGDAFARPLLDEMARRSYDLSSLLIIGSGGAPLSALNKREFLERVPQATVLDSIGSSETGMQASNPSNKQTGVSTGDFDDALSALLGKDAAGLSASTIGRLKEIWIDEHRDPSATTPC